MNCSGKSVLNSLMRYSLFIFFIGTPNSFSQNKPGGNAENNPRPVWQADRGDGTYRNPIIYADYSDPDVVRAGDDFYMISSSFQCTPVLPVLHSKDLVNWKIIGHVSENLPSPVYNEPQHGKGCWAPSIRFHDGEFYVYYGDPDLGIYMSKAKNPSGPWKPLLLVKKAKGWIDPCPLWDDDGKAYLVHAWAKSRVGFNSVLHMNTMSPDGKKIYDDSVLVFDGHTNHPTMEGPKFYKRNGYYYIFTPAGGVSTGWQTVLRSNNVRGPYEDRIVLHQGLTKINGPHQGGWVETQHGESWFVHFQDRGAYGRIIHLQPMWWKNDWPVMGTNQDSSGCGEPMTTWKKPDVGKKYSMEIPQTGDAFDSSSLGLQWQWYANHSNQWYSLTEKKGYLRLQCLAILDTGANLWKAPNLLLQKLPASQCTVTTQLSFSPVSVGEKTGLLIMGLDYSYIALVKKADGLHVVKETCRNADKGTKETDEADELVGGTSAFLRVVVDPGAVCRLSYSDDGHAFKPMGKDFTAREGRWIGAKIGLFALAKAPGRNPGYAEFDWFRIE